ncbi:MAG: leucine-rich repeat protein [Clostridia bacterium]|nr:leucine-rich repeat protein [Clostridia bacterium]
MMRKTIALLLAVCMIMIGIPCVKANTDTPGENISWEFSDGILTVTDEKIGDFNDADTTPWAEFSGEVTKIVLSGVTYVGNNAFSNMANLASVELGEDLTHIGHAAFYGAKRLASAEFPESLTRIGNGAFRNCGLTSIVLPESTKYIGSFAFENNRALYNIRIGNSVDYLGSCAFDGTAWYSAQSGNTIYISNILYKYIGGGQSFTFTQDTRGIAGRAFENLRLRSISIPEGVVFIGDSAFAGCYALTSADLPNSLKTLGYAAFADSGLRSITLPASVKSIDGAFSRCSSLSSVTMPGVKNIGGFSFFKCTSLKNISIPDGVENIGIFAFAESGIQSISIPSGVRSIGSNAFYSCTELSSATFIPEGQLDTLGDGAFTHCTALTSVTLPRSATSLGKYAFSGCTSLKTAYIPAAVNYIGDNAFVGSSPVIQGHAGSIAQNFAASCGLTFYEMSQPTTETSGIYVKQGSSGGTGTSSAPFGSVEQAIDALGGEDGTILIVDDYNISTFSHDGWEGHVEICGASDTSLLVLGANRSAIFHGDITIKDIAIFAQQYSHFNSFADMTLDIGENNSFEGIIHGSIFYGGIVPETSLTINSGSYGNIYAFGAYITNNKPAIITGDITTEINGGTITNISLSADSYAENHIGMTVQGNANVIINGGRIAKITKKPTTVPTINGALNIIFNNGTSAPSKFEYPDAEGGVYIINNAPGGKVIPTAAPGAFLLEAEDGLTPAVNGAITSATTVDLSPGTHTVEWVELKDDFSTVYYVKTGGNGNGSLDAPFGTFKDAIRALSGQNGVIKVIGNYDISNFNTGFNNRWSGKIIITSHNEDSVISLKNNAGVVFRGETEFRDIKLNIGNSAHFNPLDAKFTLDIGEDNFFNSMMHLSTYSTNSVQNAHTVVKSGTYSLLHMFGGYNTSLDHGVYGNTVVEINGGTVDNINFSADRYMDNMTGISVGGNASLIVNGGLVKKTGFNSVTTPQIMGAFNIVFNNGTAENTTLNYPECAASGTYVIKSGVGGKVLPTDTPGVFSIKANAGYIAVVNGKRSANGNITVYPGITEINWVKNNVFNIPYTLSLNKNALELSINEYATLTHAVNPNAEDYVMDHELKWVTSDNKIAVVAGGRVVGLAPGTAVISVQSPDGKVSADCEVTVVKPEPVITVSNSTARAGDIVTVDILLENNPGISEMTFEVHYDASVLEYTEFSSGDIFDDTSFTDISFSDGVCTVKIHKENWNATESGKLAAITFKVSENAEIGSYPITFTATEVLDIENTPIEIPDGVGSITVKDFISGDVTGDFNVNRQDLLRLAKYFAGWDVEIDDAASDVTGDGNINRQDLLRLAKYFAGWNVTLGS